MWQILNGCNRWSTHYLCSDYNNVDGAPDFPTAIAGKQGWTSYHPRLSFGPNNEMHINWFWRAGIAGAELSRPCHIMSTDHQSFYTASGDYQTLPALPEDCGNLGHSDDDQFYSIGNSTISVDGSPHILLSPNVWKPQNLLPGAAKQQLEFN